MALRIAAARRQLAGTDDDLVAFRANADLDRWFGRLALSRGWEGMIGTVALRLVDALAVGDLRDFAAQAMRLRREFEAEGCDHYATRVLAGLAIVRSEPVIGELRGMTRDRLQAQMKRSADQAKRDGLFPYHLLDG